jgi:hypothetical protein
MGKAYGILPTRLMSLPWVEYSLVCRIFDIGCEEEHKAQERSIERIKSKAKH